MIHYLSHDPTNGGTGELHCDLLEGWTLDS